MNPQTLLEYLLTCYPVFLMLLFVVVCMIQVVVTSKTEQKDPQNNEDQHPRQTWNPIAFSQIQPFSRTVKPCFNWLSAGVLVTFFANATIYTTHVLMARSEYWWRGQSVVVRLYALRLLLLCYVLRPNNRRFISWALSLPTQLFFSAYSIPPLPRRPLSSHVGPSPFPLSLLFLPPPSQFIPQSTMSQ